VLAVGLSQETTSIINAKIHNNAINFFISSSFKFRQILSYSIIKVNKFLKRFVVNPFGGRCCVGSTIKSEASNHPIGA
jgi:hypothetical protein